MAKNAHDVGAAKLDSIMYRRGALITQTEVYTYLKSGIPPVFEVDDIFTFSVEITDLSDGD